jgi:sugar phosphate permease
VAALLDVAGALGAIVTGVVCDTVYGGATLKAAMHLCIATGLSFAGWAAVCVRGGTTSMHVVAIISIGFFIAGPGGILGASARNLVSFAGLAKDAALVAAVSGLVNGSGSVGAVLQGLLAPQLVALLGWAGLFGALAAAMLGAALVLSPAMSIEAEALAKKKQKAA